MEIYFIGDIKLFENQLLISVPLSGDLSFEKVVVYVCEHTERGAVGLIINRPTEYNMDFIFDQLGIEKDQSTLFKQPVLFGGPVQQDRGFVIHKPLEGFDPNLGLNDEICVSTSQEILRRIASGQGPDNCLVTLGYAGWAAEQLDSEIKQSLWLTCAANEELVYHTPFDDKWQACVDSLGFDINKLITTSSGNA